MDTNMSEQKDAKAIYTPHYWDVRTHADLIQIVFDLGATYAEAKAIARQAEVDSDTFVEAHMRAAKTLREMDEVKKVLLFRYDRVSPPQIRERIIRLVERIAFEHYRHGGKSFQWEGLNTFEVVAIEQELSPR